MFKVSFHVRHCLIPPFNVSDPTVPFIRVPIGSSSALCYNERRVYEIGMERLFALERNSKVFFFYVSLLGLRFPKQGQSVYQLSALLALGLSSGTEWLSRNTIECNLWLCLMSHSAFLFMLHIRVFSLSTSSSSPLSVAFCIEVFPLLASCLHPSSSMASLSSNPPH